MFHTPAHKATPRQPQPGQASPARDAGIHQEFVAWIQWIKDSRGYLAPGVRAEAKAKAINAARAAGIAADWS